MAQHKIQRLIAALLALFPTLCLASGDAQIIGKMPDGSQYILHPSCTVEDPEYPRCMEVSDLVTVFKVQGKKYTALGKTICSVHEDRSGKLLYRCVRDGKTPFSGVVYAKREFKGSCEKGDPDYVYRCIENCSSVPRTMKQDYWEC